MNGAPSFPSRMCYTAIEAYTFLPKTCTKLSFPFLYVLHAIYMYHCQQNHFSDPVFNNWYIFYLFIGDIRGENLGLSYNVIQLPNLASGLASCLLNLILENLFTRGTEPPNRTLAIFCHLYSICLSWLQNRSDYWKKKKISYYNES